MYFLPLMLLLKMLNANHLRAQTLPRLDGAYRSFILQIMNAMNHHIMDVHAVGSYFVRSFGNNASIEWFCPRATSWNQCLCLCSECYNHIITWILSTRICTLRPTAHSVCIRKWTDWHENGKHHRSAAKTRKIESILTFLPSHFDNMTRTKKLLPEMRKPVTIMTPILSFQFVTRHLLLFLHFFSYLKEAEMPIYDLIAFHLIIARGHDDMLAPASMETH